MPLLFFFHDISNADAWDGSLSCFPLDSVTLITCSIHSPNFATKFRCILTCFRIAVWEFVTSVFVSLHTGVPFSSLFISVCFILHSFPDSIQIEGVLWLVSFTLLSSYCKSHCAYTPVCVFSMIPSTEVPLSLFIAHPRCGCFYACHIAHHAYLWASLVNLCVHLSPK